MKNDNKSSEVKKALSSIDGMDPVMASQVMEMLDKTKLLHYSSGDEVSLFSTAGRIMYSLMDDPTMTQRALSVYLDLSETMIEKTLKTLMAEGLITKTKLNRKNVYTFDIKIIENHPDIQRLPGVISRIKALKHKSQQVDEEAPF